MKDLPFARNEDTLALARALIPSSRAHDGVDAETVNRTEGLLGGLLPAAVVPWRLAHQALAGLVFARTGKRVSQLPAARLDGLLQSWNQNALLKEALHPLASVYKITHFDRTDVKGALRLAPSPISEEKSERWQANVFEAFEEEDLECDVVVVGSGAGGPVVANHLAAQGHAVVLVEEGDFHKRGDFPGHFVGSLTKLYKTTFAWGSSPVLMPRGRLVGGSTAVNGGTCFRPPAWVNDKWCKDTGSNDFSEASLNPYFEKIESKLDIAAPASAAAGPFRHLFDAGCEKLGWHGDLVKRNAPGCTGEGFCDNGCRTGARKSTDVSYVPSALSRGAVLLTGLRVDEVLTEKGEVRGVAGWARSKDGRLRRVRTRAPAVVLSGGALATPELLLRQKIACGSGQVGRNLTIHPSGASLGLFDRDLDVAKYIPQAHFSEEHLKDGLLILSAQPDSHMLPGMLPFVGSRLMKGIEQHRRIAGMGFLAADEARGRLRLLPGGRPFISYQPTKKDALRFKKGHELLAKLFLASGAKEIYPSVKTPTKLHSAADIEAFSRQKMQGKDFILTAFHPLGTCRMSSSRSDSVVDLNHECHEQKGLFIVDGSVVSGPLGVNPQLSIMAFAARAAECIDQRLQSLAN